MKTKDTSKQEDELATALPDEKSLQDIEKLNEAMTEDFIDLYLKRKPEKAL